MITKSPWGRVERTTEYGEGVIFVSTASHGGFYVEPRLYDLIPPEWRAYAQEWARGATGWFEEDCAWFAVALTFPSRFGMEEVAMAGKIRRSLEQARRIPAIEFAA